MSLIDPSTPEGFFHMRLVPFKMRLLNSGGSYFPLGPDSACESYFEEPTDSSERAADAEAGPGLLTSAEVLQALREKWNEEDETLLVELSDSLDALREHLMKRPESKSESDEQPSDFVYPLF